MYIVPNLINSAHRPARLRPITSEDDAIFDLPLARAQPGGPTLTITLTRDERSRAETIALINRRYAWRGYGSDHKLSGRCEETTFTARFDGDLISTVTLATDSTNGLAVDETFPEEMQFFRRKPNTKLCELKKLAMEYGSNAKPVLASMFHFIFIYGTNTYLGTDLLIEVNPRHALFYEKMLKFRQVGAVRTNKSVDAPSQLMWLPLSDIDSAIANSSNAINDNSLYKYFYSDNFEDYIVNQINQRGLRENFAYYCH